MERKHNCEIIITESTTGKIKGTGEYREFMFKAYDYERTAEIDRSIVKKLAKTGSKDNKMKGGVDSTGKSMSCPPSFLTSSQPF